MIMDLNEVTEIIAENQWTLLVVSADGTIIECIPFQEDPIQGDLSTEWAHQNRERLKGCAVKYVPRGFVSANDLRRLALEAAKDIDLFKKYEGNEEE